MSDPWFSEHIASDGDPEEGGCHPDEAAALKDYLNPSGTTAATAARAITLPLENESLIRSVDTECWRLWSLLIDALMELPEHIIKVIELLAAIQSLPMADHDDNNPLQRRVQWSVLPGFGYLWADLKVERDWSDMLKWSPEQREGIRRDYINQAAIEARLSKAHIHGISVKYGLSTICDALERKDAVLDFEVPAAKEWFVIAPEPILEASKGEATGHSSERDLWSRDKSSGERWQCWRQRLWSMLSSEDLDLETKEAAWTAYEAIQSVADHCSCS